MSLMKKNYRPGRQEKPMWRTAQIALYRIDKRYHLLMIRHRKRARSKNTNGINGDGATQRESV